MEAGRTLSEVVIAPDSCLRATERGVVLRHSGLGVRDGIRNYLITAA